MLVGGEGEKRTLRTAAAFADVANWQVGITEFIRKSRVLTDFCETIGRNPITIRRTHAANFQLFESKHEFQRWRQSKDRGMSAKKVDAYIRDRGAFYGTAEAIQEMIEEFYSSGCRGFMIFCNKAPSIDGLEELASLLPIPIEELYASHTDPARTPYITAGGDHVRTGYNAYSTTDLHGAVLR